MTLALELLTTAIRERDEAIAERDRLRAENDLLRDELVEAQWALKRDPAAVFGRWMAGRVGA